MGDNVVRGGALLDAGSNDPRVQGVRAFQEGLAADPRLEATTIQTVGSRAMTAFDCACLFLSTNDAHRDQRPGSTAHPRSVIQHHGYAAVIDDRDGTQAQHDAASADLAASGQRDAPIEIVAYDPAWPGRFDDEFARLAPLLPGAEIHHIGSTAVPDLAAKPVIDIMALVSDLDEPIQTLVEHAGYEYPPAYNRELNRCRWLCKPSASHRTHHLHLVIDRDFLDRRLRFRDRLRRDHALREAYAELKRDLAARNREDRATYGAAKSGFIKRHSGLGSE